MKLTVVGCSGSFPGPLSPGSCYLVEHDGVRLLLDMGNGSLGALANYADIYSIDAIVISHLHIDHCVDVGSYYVARKYSRYGPMPAIPVYGPAGIADRMCAIYGIDEGTPMSEIFDFREYDGSEFSVGAMTVGAHGVWHCGIPAYGISVSAGGKRLIYSGDTGPCDALVEAARGADVALFEASYLTRHENPEGIHLTGREAAQAAIDAGVDRLILTHLVPWNDSAEVLQEATEIYNGTVTLASPGMREDI